jgi:hypothetical protein
MKKDKGGGAVGDEKAWCWTENKLAKREKPELS